MGESQSHSQRTKVALAQAKARGTHLGTPHAAEAAALARAAIVTTQTLAKVVGLIKERRASGASLRETAGELNQKQEVNEVIHAEQRTI